MGRRIHVRETVGVPWWSRKTVENTRKSESCLGAEAVGMGNLVSTPDSHLFFNGSNFCYKVTKKYKLDLAFNNVKPKEKSFVFD